MPGFNKYYASIDSIRYECLDGEYNYFMFHNERLGNKFKTLANRRTSLMNWTIIS